MQIKPIDSFNAEITVPGDKSISHRAAMLSALSNGICHINNFLPSEDCLSTLKALEKLGTKITNKKGEKLNYEQIINDEIFSLDLIIHGKNMKFDPPSKHIDCGNSGTTIRLLAGILAGQKFNVKLIGDASLSKRPMKRIIDPIEEMGGKILTQNEDSPTPPLTICGRNLKVINYTMPIASAQVKSAIMLAALYTKGKSTIVEKAKSRNHTEQIFKKFGIKTIIAGNSISVYGDQTPVATDIEIPGDISSAAFWICLAAALPGSKLTVNNVGLNNTRCGFLKVLLRMGANITEHIESKDGEKVGSLVVKGVEKLQATTIQGEEIPTLIDELPILALLASQAEGETLIRDAEELRHKETNRISALVTNLLLMGIEVNEFADGLSVKGGELTGANLKSFGDHRIAMTFAIAGLLANGETSIDDIECVKISYPNFAHVLTQFSKKFRK